MLLIILASVWHKSIHFWRDMREKQFLHFRSQWLDFWSLDFLITFWSHFDQIGLYSHFRLSIGMYQPNYKFLWLSCFKKIGGNGQTDGPTDRRMDGRSAALNAIPRKGRVLCINTAYQPAYKACRRRIANTRQFDSNGEDLVNRALTCISTTSDIQVIPWWKSAWHWTIATNACNVMNTRCNCFQERLCNDSDSRDVPYNIFTNSRFEIIALSVLVNQCLLTSIIKKITEIEKNWWYGIKANVICRKATSLFSYSPGGEYDRRQLA